MIDLSAFSQEDEVWVCDSQGPGEAQGGAGQQSWRREAWPHPPWHGAHHGQLDHDKSDLSINHVTTESFSFQQMTDPTLTAAPPPPWLGLGWSSLRDSPQSTSCPGTMSTTSLSSRYWHHTTDVFNVSVPGARCLRCVCLGGAAGRHPEREDRQQHAGEGDPQRGLQGGAGGLLCPQLRVQRRPAAGWHGLSLSCNNNVHPRLMMMRMLRTRWLWKFMRTMMSRLLIKMFHLPCIKLVKVQVEND